MLVQSRYLSLSKNVFFMHLSARSRHKFLNKSCKLQNHVIQVRDFRNFGPEINRDSSRTRAFFLGILSFGALGVFVNWKWVGQEIEKVFHVRVVDMSEEKDEENQDTSEKQDDSEPKKKKKKSKVGFRARKIREYENRLRRFSIPDKTFRYFATVKISNLEGFEIYMTPDDFLRAITPGMQQPDGLGLDQYKRFDDPKSVHSKLELELDENSIFYKLGSAGLISFSDYVFLLTALSTSRRHFEIAFRMFDFNGDEEVDFYEFNKVSTLLRQQTSIRNRHRDHANTGNRFKGVNSVLTTYFFGSKKDKKLTVDKFLEFQEQFQKEILSFKFERRNPDADSKITEVDFAKLLLTYAGYSKYKKRKVIKKVKKQFKDNPQGVSKEDYLKFFHFLNNINDVNRALTFYNIAGVSIDQATLKHVARTVAHVELSDHIIHVVFAIFDEDLDGQLSNREFIAVIKNRLSRGLDKRKDTGFVKLMESVIKCAKSSYSFNYQK